MVPSGSWDGAAKGRLGHIVLATTLGFLTEQIVGKCVAFRTDVCETGARQKCRRQEEVTMADFIVVISSR
jgi:hypothetical protein